MNLRTFIERPVLSAVISITIVILGIIGLFTLPVRCKRRNSSEECNRSVGRGYKRCGRHDLHDFYRQ